MFLLWLSFYSILSLSFSHQHSIRVSTYQSMGLPVLSLCNGFTFMLDTGSSESWLADASCSDCKRGVAGLCPWVTGSGDVKVNYMSGWVSGEKVHWSGCGTGEDHRILCVKENKGMGDFGGQGILGLRGEVGAQILQKAGADGGFGVYYGQGEVRVLMGELGGQWWQKRVRVAAGEQKWSVVCEGLAIENEKIGVASGRLFVDTGSNGLVVPQTIFSPFLTSLSQQLRNEGCSIVTQPSFSFFCRNQPYNSILITLSDSQSLHIPLYDLCTMRDGWCDVRLWPGPNAHSILVGSAVIRSYLVWFDWNGRIQLFHSRREYFSAYETINFQLAMLQYWLLLILGVFALNKFYEALSDNMNRTQVI